MIKTEPSPSPRGKESHAIVTTVFALLLIGLCLWASHWQYARGVARHHRNFIIASHVDQPITTLDAIGRDVSGAEWRKVSVTGRFDPTHQILLRNQYSQGTYGFDLLTLFTDTGSMHFGLTADGLRLERTPLPLPHCLKRLRATSRSLDVSASRTRFHRVRSSPSLLGARI